MSLESIAAMLWAIYKSFTDQIEGKVELEKTYLVEITGEEIMKIYHKSRWLYTGLKEIEE